jgi:hypothetical protein
MAEEGLPPCPKCGGELSVDQVNSVVYCKKCGWAAQINPETGETTVLSEGGGRPPAAYGHEGQILGFDPLTFWLIVTALVFLFVFMNVLNLTYGVLIEAVVTVYWWMKK